MLAVLALGIWLPSGLMGLFSAAARLVTGT